MNSFLNSSRLLALCGPLLECLFPWAGELNTKITNSYLWKYKSLTFSLNMEPSSTGLLWRCFLPCALQHVWCQLSRNNFSISMESSVAYLLLLLHSGERRRDFYVYSLWARKIIPKLKRGSHSVTSYVMLLNFPFCFSKWRFIFKNLLHPHNNNILPWWLPWKDYYGTHGSMLTLWTPGSSCAHSFGRVTFPQWLPLGGAPVRRWEWYLPSSPFWFGLFIAANYKIILELV